MAAFSILVSKYIFLNFLSCVCFISATESTVFAKKAAEKQDENINITSLQSSASIEDTLFVGSVGYEQPKTSAVKSDDSVVAFTLDKTNKEYSTISEDDKHSILNAHKSDTEFSPFEDQALNIKNDKQSGNISNVDNQNEMLTSQSDTNSTDKKFKPPWKCRKYNMTEQKVIVLEDTNSLTSWLNEVNKTTSCAVVLFYAKWCFFSASVSPIYNAVGRAFSGVPILAFDAYTHNSLNTRYGIVGVPTIILFQESRPVARFNRSRTFKDLVEFIHQATGLDYNTSVELSQTDYDEGPLPSKPSEAFNFHLFASLCFLLAFAVLVLWHLRYLQVLLQYCLSLMPVRTSMATNTREKID